MQIKYSKHLESRLSLRKIEYGLPQKIYKQSKARYFDEETGHLISTMKTKFYDKIRDVMIAYVVEQDYVKILTIHPLRKGQREKRVKIGRWRRI